MNSAYSVFKSPTSLNKRQGFSGNGFAGFQGRVNYTPKPRPKINLTAFQRQNPDRYCLHVADIQESVTTHKAFDRTEKPKKKLERPVDCRPQTYLKDSFVPDCVDQAMTGYGNWSKDLLFNGSSDRYACNE